MYFATVSTRPPSGSGTVFVTAARPKVRSPTSFARPASRSAAATISPGPAVPLSTLISVKFMPSNAVVALATRWAPLMEASYSSSPSGVWQVAH